MASNIQMAGLKYGDGPLTSPSPIFMQPLQTRSMEIQHATTRFQFEKFEPEKHEWDYYIAQFETQLHIQNLMDLEAAEARKKLLLTNLGSQAFKVLMDRFSPDQPFSKSYEELKSALQSHYGKKTCVMAERKAFQLRMRKKNETVTNYLNELRKIAANCKFGQSQTERLRDQLVIGINNPVWQQELLRQFSAEDASLQQVETAAQILEQATVQQHRMQSMNLGDQEAATAKKPKQKPVRVNRGPRGQVSVGITNVTVQQQPQTAPVLQANAAHHGALSMRHPYPQVGHQQGTNQFSRPSSSAFVRPAFNVPPPAPVQPVYGVAINTHGMGQIGGQPSGTGHPGGRRRGKRDDGLK